MTVAELFDLAEDLELRHARLYAHFSLVYGEWDARIASFWEQMSTEEWQHHIILNFCRGLCESAMDMQRKAPKINLSSLKETTALLSEGLDSIQNGEPNLREAFELAVRLEQGESDTIFDALISVTQEVAELLDRPFLMERIRKAQRQADQHAQHLIVAVRRFAGSPELVRHAQQVLTSS